MFMREGDFPTCKLGKLGDLTGGGGGVDVNNSRGLAGFEINFC